MRLLNPLLLCGSNLKVLLRRRLCGNSAKLDLGQDQHVLLLGLPSGPRLDGWASRLADIANIRHKCILLRAHHL